MNAAIASCSFCCAATASLDASGESELVTAALPTTIGTRDVATEMGTPPEVNAAWIEELSTDAATRLSVADSELAAVIRSVN